MLTIDIMYYCCGIWDVLMVDLRGNWYKEVPSLMIKYVSHKHLCLMSISLLYRPFVTFTVIIINSYILNYEGIKYFDLLAYK